MVQSFNPRYATGEEVAVGDSVLYLGVDACIEEVIMPESQRAHDCGFYDHKGHVLILDANGVRFSETFEQTATSEELEFVARRRM